jgi:sugar lactone lactonase YvrE
MNAQPELLREAAADVGEGPAWDAATQTLLWVDIHACEAYREDLSGGTEVIRVDRHVGAALPSAVAGEVLLMLRDGFWVRRGDGSLTELTSPLADRPGMRFNDGKVDPRGRAFGGTMPYTAGTGLGALYRLDPGPVATTCVDPLFLSNGLGWTPDGTGMYVVDSGAQAVFRHAYDADSGSLSAPVTFVDVPTDEGMPDGLTVDDDGCVWLALWGGGQIRRYTPDGRLDRVVELPVSQPTSMCFVGADLSTLAITTARYGLDADALSKQPLAGSLFALDVRCSGPAATPWVPFEK